MDEQVLVERMMAARQYFESGATRPYAFRKAQLLKLKKALLEEEAGILAALHQDLRKSPEESYASELGLVLAEINLALKKLKSWMKPSIATTNLVNLPSQSRIYRDALGVVFIIAPWNYPLQLLILPLVGALAGGNCVVLKPSELAPATAGLIEKIIARYFEQQYVQVVQGDGSAIIPPLMKAFRFDHVFYTGSIPVGQSIYELAARQLVPVTLELGGKSPVIVEAGANLGVAARRIVQGKFLNAGQSCIAPDYILVDASITQALISQLTATIDHFYGKDAALNEEYGKIINEKRFDKLLDLMNQAKVVYGGKSNREKRYIAPTLLTDVGLETGLMNEEIFGPLLPILSVNSREEAMQIVKRQPNPLALYLFTNNTESERQWMENTAFGGGCVNNTAWYFSNHHLPFGGVGNSGIGAYHGKYTFNTFTRSKPVMKTPTWFDPSIKYPPYKGKLKLFRWFFR